MFEIPGVTITLKPGQRVSQPFLYNLADFSNLTLEIDRKAPPLQFIEVAKLQGGGNTIMLIQDAHDPNQDWVVVDPKEYS